MVRWETRRRGVRLEVTAAYRDDEGSQRVRLDPASLLHLGASTGDTVEIQGASLTFGIAEKVRLEHYNRGNIYLPALLRENASASVGEMVTVEPATLEPATTVRLRATERGVLPVDDVAHRPDLFERLHDRPVCVGDRLNVALDDGVAELQVTELEPDDSVVLGPDTRYEVASPTVERAQRPAEVDLD